MDLAENIKKRRLELGLSQQELADRLGYKTRSTIARIESGENTVPDSKLVKFARVLDTSVEFLKTGKESQVTYTLPRMKPGKHNIAIVLAGGKSTRNQQNIPNQFINVLGKPVIIYVLEAYQRHPAIDDIYVVCIKGWDDILSAYAKQYGIDKLRGIIPAGETGMLSVKNGFDALECDDDDTIILQESTRPLVTEESISKLLHACKGAAALCEPMEDKVMFFKKEKLEYVERDRLFDLQSPEAYRYGILKSVFEKAEQLQHPLEESCCSLLMYNLGYELNFVEGNHNNIKIVRQEDIAILSALLKNRI